MLELNQFRHSAFCLKVRMALEAKKLKYRVIDITPGVGQIAIFQISGQRKVPVLVDGETVLADSSAIIRYIEKTHPEPKLIPEEPKQAAQIHLIENWADTTLASAGRSALLQAAAIDPELRVALLPEELPTQFRQFMGGLPCDLIRNASEFLSQGKGAELLANLQQLSLLVESNPWIVGDSMTIADLAVAAQLSLLRFPSSSGEPLAGKGCPGFSDHPSLENLFHWRDQLEISLMQSN